MLVVAVHSDPVFAVNEVLGAINNSTLSDANKVTLRAAVLKGVLSAAVAEVAALDGGVALAVAAWQDEQRKEQRREEREERREQERLEERREQERRELRKHELDLAKLQSGGAIGGERSVSHSELYTSKQKANSNWNVAYSSEVRDVSPYATAPEDRVQKEMMDLLPTVNGSLAFVDTHATDVAGLGKVDIIGMPTTVAKISTASAHTAAIVVELKRRDQLADPRQFSFPSSDKGQVLDRLARMRSVRPNGPLYGMLSNGYHVAYLKLEEDVLHETTVHTLAEVGLLKAVLQLAHNDLVGGDLAFFKQLPDVYRNLRVASRLGAGSQCEVWELADGKTNAAFAVVVAKNELAVKHLHHSVTVLRELKLAADGTASSDGKEKLETKADEHDDDSAPLTKGAKKTKTLIAAAAAAPAVPSTPTAPSPTVPGPGSPAAHLYTLIYFARSPLNSGIAIFREVGARWTPETKLARRDLSDIAAQLEFIHGAGYVHCDVANRNMVQYVEDDGSLRSVLIDFGAAIKRSDAKSLGGTVYNAPIEWLERNWPIVSGVDACDKIDQLTPMKPADDLACFAWAVIDLRVAKVELSDVIAHRQKLMCNPVVADIFKAVEELRYAEVAAKLADALFLLEEPAAQRSKSSPTGIRSTARLSASPTHTPLATTVIMPSTQSPMRPRK
jgi:hypothetical protein